MKFNRFNKFMAGSILLLSVAGNANAEIYTFTTNSIEFATLNVTQNSITSYTFSLAFLNDANGFFNNNNYIRLLAVDDSNDTDPANTTNYSATPTNGSVVRAVLPGFVDGVSNIGGYDYDYLFTIAPISGLFKVGESATWTSVFTNAPGTFDRFSLRINNGGFALNALNAKATVLGVQSVAAVPEPETYAMFLAGLGFLGFASKCRKNA